MKKPPVFYLLLAAVLLPIASFAATVRLDVPSTPARIGSQFDVDVIVDAVLSPNELIAFGFDVVKSSSWTLDDVVFGSGFVDDSSSFANTDVAGSAFPGVNGTNILLATLQFTPSHLGYFPLTVFSDPADANEGLFLFPGGQMDVTSLVTVQVVPIPAAAWLFGSAVAGLGLLTRRRKHMASPCSASGRHSLNSVS